MGESNIEWTDATWNPVVGCARVSPGCERCYAEVQARRIELMGQTPRYKGLTVVGKHGPRWTGEVRTAPEVLAAPLRWKRPRLVFVNSMSDLFHDDVPFGYIAAVFGVMAGSPRHTFQILTKRPARMKEFFRRLEFYAAPNSPLEAVGAFAQNKLGGPPLGGPDVPGGSWPLPNVHLGVSVEDQRRADERIPLLLQCPAAVRWVSAEPLLQAVSLSDLVDGAGGVIKPLVGLHWEPTDKGGGGLTVKKPAGPRIDWVVVGGESGRDPRPFDIAWARAIVGQCKAAGVPVFVKQLGANPVIEDGAHVAWALKDRKGGDPAEWTEDLRVRMWPGDAWPAESEVPL